MAHSNPPCLASFHPHPGHVTSAPDIHHVRQKPVPISLECEPNAIFFYAWNTTVRNGDDPGLPVGDLHKSGFRHVKVNPGRVAPATVVGWFRPIRGTEIGGRHRCERNVSVTSFGLHAFDLKASSTSVAIVEKR